MQEEYVLSASELDAFASQRIKQLSGGDVLLLSGELGAGKTTLTKAIARALGIHETVTSPTFTLMNVYPVHGHDTIKQLAHIDTYRMEREGEAEEIGLFAFIGRPDTLTIIEWPEKIAEKITRGRIIELALSGSGTTRTIRTRE